MHARYSRRSLALALVLLGVGVGVVVTPLALADPPARFTAPLPGGTVDFGDRVLYRLAGTGCATEAVRVEVLVPTANVPGIPSTPAVDPLAPGTCVGVVKIPSEADVRGAGWDAGDPIAIDVVSQADRVALRYQRVEVDLGTPVAGAPVVVTPTVADPRGGAREKAMSMSTGDVVSIGPVDLTHVYSVSVRVCETAPKPHLVPTWFELRAGAPDGPAIVGPVDINDDFYNSNKSNFGWLTCWQLQPWPITGEVPGRAPELFVAVTATATPVEISFIDFNGTGAKVADTPATDPAGTQQIFDGSSFDGWTTNSKCHLEDDGSVRTVHSRELNNWLPLATFGFVGESGCSMTYSVRQLHNSMIRFEYRMQDFGANGAIMIGGHEIQMREAGEWMTGGIQGDSLPVALTNFAADTGGGGGYPAQRIKSNSYPDWSEIEIVQLGVRHVVRINGRTVTDCSTCLADPAPYNFSVSSQPNFSYHYGLNGRMDTVPQPYLDNPSNWGNVYFRNFRVYDCASETDPVCVGGPGVAG